MISAIMRCISVINFLPAVVCPVLGVWMGFEHSISRVRPTTRVNVTCSEGLAFPDAALVKELLCTPAGEWEPPVSGCKSEIFFIAVNLLVFR